MRRWSSAFVAISIVLTLGTPAARAKVIDLDASPNPAVLGDRVRHTVDVGTFGRLEVWVSATGFDRPGNGTLPAGAWSSECCPSQTAGTPSWHYRSYSTVSPGQYRFNALTRRRGTFLSTAFAGGVSDGVWIRVI